MATLLNERRRNDLKRLDVMNIFIFLKRNGLKDDITYLFITNNFALF